jgi:hypothetical protein
MEYYQLDPVIAANYTPTEWNWLSDSEKQNILGQITEPDYEEDSCSAD